MKPLLWKSFKLYDKAWRIYIAPLESDTLAGNVGVALREKRAIYISDCRLLDLETFELTLVHEVVHAILIPMSSVTNQSVAWPAQEEWLAEQLGMTLPRLMRELLLTDKEFATLQMKWHRRMKNV